MSINPKNVVYLLYQEFNEFKSSDITSAEIELKCKLKEIIQNCITASEILYEDDEDLIIEDEKYSACKDNEYFLQDEIENETELSQLNSESSYELSLQQRRNFIKFDQKKDAVNYWKSGKTKALKLSTVRHRYNYVTSITQLRRFEKQIKEAGSKFEKFNSIKNETLLRFQTAKENRLIVHDNDIKRWAKHANKNLNQPLENFKASNTWLLSFKRAHKIVSRKITKIVSKKHFLEEDVILSSANDFVSSVRSLMNSFEKNEIFNTDQSGFRKENHSGRTLAEKGSKKVEAVLQSVNATTHSYTIQPTISADGELLSPLLICLQEPNGKFPNTKKIFESRNIYTVASKSGLMTKDLLMEFFEKVLFPNTPDRMMLLFDSLTTHNDTPAMDYIKPLLKEIKVMQIPPRTTGIIQPLDVYFFRMWKDFVRKISDRVILDELPIKLYQRDNILKLQSLTHNQFISPRFKNFVKYAWFKAGYLEVKPEEHITPVKYCFGECSTQSCMAVVVEGTCGTNCFIRCAHCEFFLCFEHFFVKFHYCSS